MAAGDPGKVGFSSGVQSGAGSNKRGDLDMTCYPQIPCSKNSTARLASFS